MRGEEPFISRDNPPQTPPAFVPSRLTPSFPEIKGFLETSFIDWPGKLCAMLFLGGCNFRCPFCHNHPLVLAPGGMDTIPFAEVAARLNSRKKWLGGICISGGEPTLSPALPNMIAHLKAEGWAIKLDTNGSRPAVLRDLLADGLLDMVAMDIKAPLDPEKYARCTGGYDDVETIRQSIALLAESAVPHEFRMTVLPRLHSEEDILGWVSLFDKKRSRLKLQNFNPKTTLDPRFEQEKGFAEDVFCRLSAVLN